MPLPLARGRRDKLGRVRPRELAGNLALALGAGAFFLGLVEGGARLVETRRAPRPEVADYIWDWGEKMAGDFYVIGPTPWAGRPGRSSTATACATARTPNEKPDGSLAGRVLGDSVTLGAGLEPDEAYPQVLGAARGARAAGRGDERRALGLVDAPGADRLGAHRAPYRPDQVVLAVCLNDIPELQNNLARPPPAAGRAPRALGAGAALVDARGARDPGRRAALRRARTRRACARRSRSSSTEVRALRRGREADGATLRARRVPVPLPGRAGSAFAAGPAADRGVLPGTRGSALPRSPARICGRSGPGPSWTTTT